MWSQDFYDGPTLLGRLVHHDDGTVSAVRYDETGDVVEDRALTEEERRFFCPSPDEAMPSADDRDTVAAFMGVPLDVVEVLAELAAAAAEADGDDPGAG